YEPFKVRYAARFGKAPEAYAENGYDAAYTLGYAVAAAKGPITGASLSAAFAKLVPPGKPIDVGPDGAAQALSLLAAGTAIDITGASGPMDYDLATGDVTADIDVWCVGLDASMTPAFQSSGQYFDAAKGQLEGTISCP